MRFGVQWSLVEEVYGVWCFFLLELLYCLLLLKGCHARAFPKRFRDVNDDDADAGGDENVYFCLWVSGGLYSSVGKRKEIVFKSK